MSAQRETTLVGAGLVGALLATLLAQRGFRQQDGQAAGRVSRCDERLHAGEPAGLRHQHGLGQHGALHHVLGVHNVPIRFFPCVDPQAFEAQ